MPQKDQEAVPAGYRVGYACLRRKLSAQTRERLIEQFRSVGCEDFFFDECSEPVGRPLKDRPNLSRVISYLIPGGVLWLWKPSDLGEKASTILERIRQVVMRQCAIRTLQDDEAAEPLKPNEPLHVVEIALKGIQECRFVQQELRNSEPGYRPSLGRPARSLTGFEVRTAIAMLEREASITSISKFLNINRLTLARRLNDLGIRPVRANR